MIHTHPSLTATTTLLDAAGLPSSDLTERHLEHFLFSGPRHSPTGVIGLEMYGHVALLRSLAVDPVARKTGVGSRLVQEAEALAQANGIQALYLLTTTARHFFEKRGYSAISRSDCPEAIRSTAEFASLCPASSALLMKTL